MKPIIIAANWKMQKTLQEGVEWVQETMDYLTLHALPSTQVVLLPSFIHLEAIHQLLLQDPLHNLRLLPSGVRQEFVQNPHLPYVNSGFSQIPSFPKNKILGSAKGLPYENLHLGAQNCHDQLSGAFTGEVSAAMLASVGASYVLVGHSERRQHFAESHEQIARKIDAALQCNMQPIFCCGEPWEVRERNQHYAYIGQQIADSLFHLTAEQIQQVTIAYEPVWAIGTGKTPDTAAIADMQAAIRDVLVQRYNTSIADHAMLLYGGSCNANNVRDFIHITGINGVLVGGASLQVKDFLGMLSALQR